MINLLIDDQFSMVYYICKVNSYVHLRRANQHPFRDMAENAPGSGLPQRSPADLLAVLAAAGTSGLNRGYTKEVPVRACAALQRAVIARYVSADGA
ncbi:hypothetical protein [Rugamonas sp.]|uniref:hypothetical protein n=1 Tax=Rugamonas sp. TaxID=1926287 RepID=UPI0025D96768|nr:hypothetical protein [Rugamonas sp.]